MSDADELRKAAGQRLRWAREQAGLSQGQAAAQMGMHRPTVSQIEAGDRNVKVGEYERFAEIYGVEEAWLMKGDAALDGEKDPRIELVARELGKLKKEDLDSILRLIRVLRSPGGNGRGE